MRRPNRPPQARLSASAWATRRTPRSLLLTCACLLGVAVAVGISHRPTDGQRAADLRGVLQTMTADIESCAGGVRESLTVLQAIRTGASRDQSTALDVARTGAANCSPANNELLDDLEVYQPPESLYSYHLQHAVTALIDWAAPSAAAVQADVAAELAAGSARPRAAAQAALRRDLHLLDVRRAAVYAALQPAIESLSPHAAPPVLPG